MLDGFDHRHNFRKLTIVGLNLNFDELFDPLKVLLGDEHELGVQVVRQSLQFLLDVIQVSIVIHLLFDWGSCEPQNSRSLGNTWYKFTKGILNCQILTGKSNLS